MFQSISGKIDKFGWWYLEIISVDAGTQFNSTEFKEEFRTSGVQLVLEAPEHQEMNGQVKVTWRTFRTIAHSLIVYARVLEAYIHFSLMYTVDHIFPVLPIKDLTNEYSHPTMPFKPFVRYKTLCIAFTRVFFHLLYKNLLHTLGQMR